ncbi:MAG: CDP-diacylglycerol--serine O-phosphatidyltransferase [Flavobacteriales bacterium]|nr:CDP-diacylglycerol--serine O-phosphatidyltransferase [Flavobacteriales bacterium]
MKNKIPNLITLANLFCGCIGIVFAFQNDLEYCAAMIGLAAVFDFFDGASSRLLKVSSKMGKELDSLSDLVSFGVLPSMIMYRLLEISLTGSAVFVVFIIACASSYRLAKFNLDERQTTSFIGLPTPANAILIGSFPLILNADIEYINQILLSPYFLISITLLLSFLLICELPLFSLKFNNFKWEGNKVRYLFLILSSGMFITLYVVANQFLAIPLIIMLYVLMSLINNYTRNEI